MRNVIAQLIVTLLWIPVAANAQTLTLEQRFKQLDRNGDQRLSRQELRQTPNILRADRNRDGFVSLDEARALIGNRNRRAPPEPTQEHASGESSAMFELMQRSEMPSGALAVGVLDVDSDGSPDLLLSSTRRSGVFHLARNEIGSDGERTFEITSNVMSERPADNAKRRITKGLGLHDFNNDGRLDIYLGNSDRGTQSLAPDGKTVRHSAANASSINSVQIAQGNGVFRTRDLGIDSKGSTIRSVVFADFDGDGHFDSYHSVSPYYGPGWGGSPFGNELHAGTKAWDRFGPDIIRDVLPDPAFWQDEHGRGIKLFKATLVRDLDGDGKPDIVTGAYADIWGGSFRRLQTPEDAKLDLDNDSIPDTTWPGYWERGLFLLRNVSSPGKIRFEDVSNVAVDRAYSDGTRYPQMHVYSILAADIDHDADLDLLVTGPRNSSAHRSAKDITPTARLLRNDSQPGRLKFTDITTDSGFAFLNAASVEGYRLRRGVPNLASGAPVDYDNDGHVDFVFADRQDGNVAAPLTPWLFRNTGSGRFELIAPTQHGMRGNFNDMSYADFDDDGRVDLVFVNGDPRGNGYFSVYRNAIENDHHWMKVNVTWPENKLGIGSRVTVLKAGTDEVLGYDEARTDVCYRSKRSTTLHFGLGSETAVDVRVTTRSGIVRVFENVPADQSSTLKVNHP